MISQVVKTRVKIELAVSLWKNVITSLNYLHTACSPLWTAVPLLLLDTVDNLSVHKHLKNCRVPLLSWLASAARWCFSDLSTWVTNYCAVLAIVEKWKNKHSLLCQMWHFWEESGWVCIWPTALEEIFPHSVCVCGQSSAQPYMMQFVCAFAPSVLFSFLVFVDHRDVKWYLIFTTSQFKLNIFINNNVHPISTLW